MNLFLFFGVKIFGINTFNILFIVFFGIDLFIVFSSVVNVKALLGDRDEDYWANYIGEFLEEIENGEFDLGTFLLSLLIEFPLIIVLGTIKAINYVIIDVPFFIIMLNKGFPKKTILWGVLIIHFVYALLRTIRSRESEKGSAIFWGMFIMDIIGLVLMNCYVL